MKPPLTDTAQNPYDEFPYLAYPIERTAPEHLALASLLHGGPRLPLDRYRVLELGCASGANLLPLAWYRRHGEFTGLDASGRQIGTANECKARLGLTNVRFIHGDFRSATDQVEGPFDIIMAHGVFSWVPDDARDALLEISARMLAPHGLLYVNYNAHPGWTVRGLVRDFLMQKTAHAGSLEKRAELCRQISASVISPFRESEHSFTSLLVNEFRLVVNHHPAYIAHEYLSPVNRAYWRAEFFEILRNYGFAFIADADFNCISNRITDEVAGFMKRADLDDQAAGDAADLMCYRQMQSPLLTRAPLDSRPCGLDEFSTLYMASRLAPLQDTDQETVFLAPGGGEIEVTDEPVRQALKTLHPEWPRGRRVDSLFTDVGQAREPLEYMLRNQLIELRCIEPGDFGVAAEPLNALEKSLRNISTSAWHAMTVHADET